jgi:hypothetical protein
MHLRAWFVFASSLLIVPSVASAADFTGFWKGDCSEAFGIQIKPHNEKNYSVSFCAPGGCFKPGAWMPNTSIEGDPAYRVINAKTIEIKNAERWQRLTKCTTDTNPVLTYSTMKGGQQESGITFFEPNQGLPDYEKTSPFVGHDSRLYKNLKNRLATVATAPKFCETGKAAVPPFGERPLFSNLCKRPEFEEVRNLVSSLAPSLDKSRLTVWKTALHAAGSEGLLVGYIDISNDKNFRYPYLSLWYLNVEKGKFHTTYGGSYLAGQVHTIRQFGLDGSQKRVFVKYQSCIECRPWVLMTVVDFPYSGKASPFQFTYAPDHKEFSSTFKYELPGMGHSVEADVESRLPRHAGTNSPHLLQHFKYRNEAKREWWVFTCKELKCDYEMYLKELPSKYGQAWNTAEKL